MADSKKVSVTPPRGKSLTIGVSRAKRIDPEKVRIALGAEKILHLRKTGRVR